VAKKTADKEGCRRHGAKRPETEETAAKKPAAKKAGEESLMAGPAAHPRRPRFLVCRRTIPATGYRPEWFRKDEAFDAAIRERFGAEVEAALGADRLRSP
jgi:hypothetical protein